MNETSQELTVARPDPSIANIIQAVIEKGVTSENAEVVEKLMTLWERAEDRKSEREFAIAFVHLQATLPKISATRAVENKDGTTRYRWAPIEDVVKQISPTLKECGFSFSFSESFDEGRLTEKCTIQHIGGHKRVNEFSIRVPTVPAANETQCDGAASSYAKRYCLLDALGIVVEKLDDDARNLGGHITQEQAKSLADRVLATKSDARAFLKFAGAPDFEAISQVRYDLLDQFLAKRERLQKGKAS